MDRRLFIGTLAGGLVTTLLLNKSGESSPRMPTVFVGHGSPMNAVQKNSFTDFLKDFPRDLPKPKAILVVSAHWETRGTKVLKIEVPKTIHDFGGFPEALYQIQYPAHGDPALADRITKLSSLHQIETDGSWGLDHGTWSVLKHMYPLADIPVLQLSLNQNMTFAEHLAIAGQLKPLRDEGVLILGSGNVTHNLRRVVWDENARPVDWAVEFDGLVKEAILKRDDQFLLGKETKHKDLWTVAHPSVEHYLPLLYAYGASDAKDQVKFAFEGMQLGTLSMRSMIFS
jgi:4,5-DOPA dioxygenase extradiol